MSEYLQDQEHEMKTTLNFGGQISRASSNEYSEMAGCGSARYRFSGTARQGPAAATKAEKRASHGSRQKLAVAKWSIPLAGSSCGSGGGGGGCGNSSGSGSGSGSGRKSSRRNDSGHGSEGMSTNNLAPGMGGDCGSKSSRGCRAATTAADTASSEPAATVAST